MNEPVNLEEVFGHKYRVTYEEGFTSRQEDAIWGMELKGRFGVIAPFGGTTLQVIVDNHPGAAAQLAALPNCRLIQDGSTEKTFLFDVADLEKVAAIVLPRRKRVLTDSQRAALAAAGAANRFAPRGTDAKIEARTHAGEAA